MSYVLVSLVIRNVKTETLSDLLIQVINDWTQARY